MSTFEKQQIGETTKFVFERIQKSLEDIKGGKLYYELVEQLGLINQPHFDYLVNLQISARLYNPDKESQDPHSKRIRGVRMGKESKLIKYEKSNGIFLFIFFFNRLI